LEQIFADEQPHEELRGVKGAQPWYIRLFIIRAIVVVVLLAAGISLEYNFLIYPLVIAQLTYFIAILIGRPYNNTVDNLGLILCETTILYALMLPLAMRFITISETIEMMLTFALQAMLILVFLFAIIRLMLHYKRLIGSHFFSDGVSIEMEEFPSSRKKMIKSELKKDRKPINTLEE
jgi:hypothetical protein